MAEALKELYLVHITYEAETTVPVMAISGDEAETIAGDSVSIDDLNVDTWKRAALMKTCNREHEDEQPEGLNSGDNRTCLEIFTEMEKEKRRIEMEDLEPKLPGFEQLPEANEGE